MSGKENNLKQITLRLPGLFLWLFNVLAPASALFVFIQQKQENLQKHSFSSHNQKTILLSVGK